MEQPAVDSRWNQTVDDVESYSSVASLSKTDNSASALAIAAVLEISRILPASAKADLDSLIYHSDTMPDATLEEGVNWKLLQHIGCHRPSTTTPPRN